MSSRVQRIPDTERRNPRTRGLDRLPTRALLERINREDARVAYAVARQIPVIARAVETIVAALRAGGRLMYVGAGTSGRLAVLDAAECPPTFGVPPHLVQAVVAGGGAALEHAVEGAEDSAAQGRRDLKRRRLSRSDVVVGLSASGTTPYVLGALRYARSCRAKTVAVTCNPEAPLTQIADLVIAPQVGPEVIAGSTRLKAGTAQKLVLNMLSTAAMVRLGHVYDNWMIHVAPANRKLRERALRILQQATGTSQPQAARALAQAAAAAPRAGTAPGHNALPVALIMLKRHVDAAEAWRRLRAAGGNLRRALGETGRP